MLPNMPVGQPDINWNAMVGSPTWNPPSQGVTRPGGDAQSQAQQDQEEARRWDRYLAQTQEMLRQSAGMERWKVQQQLADAQKGRDNAYRIAELSAQTSRYGT